jgi:hypothetical protein
MKFKQIKYIAYIALLNNSSALGQVINTSTNGAQETGWTVGMKCKGDKLLETGSGVDFDDCVIEC